MNNYFKYAAMAVIATVSFSMTSCGDDDDENDAPELPEIPVIDQVFPEGVPSKIGNTNIETNAAGQVTRILTQDGGSIEIAEFSYGVFSRATDYQVKMKLHDTYDPQDSTVIYMQLNDKNFVKYALEIYSDGETDEWWFDYNADGQLNYLKRSEGDNEVTRITYANGNIIGVAVTDDDHKTPSTYSISYTDDNVKAPIANKGGIMLFDDLFHVDMDEMEVAYYAGLLGKSTQSLPVNMYYANSEGEYNDSFIWTLNNAGLPTKLVIKGEAPLGTYEDETTFVW